MFVAVASLFLVVAVFAIIFYTKKGQISLPDFQVIFTESLMAAGGLLLIVSSFSKEFLDENYEALRFSPILIAGIFLIVTSISKFLKNISDK